MSVLQTVVVVLWLWGAWLPPALPSCTTGQAAECKAAPSAPGTNLAGEGFDIVTMKRKQAYVIDMDTWEKTTNGSCTLCVNSFMEGQTQRLPIAVVDWRPLHRCQMKVDSMVYDSSEAFVQDSQTEVDASWKIGLDITTPQAKGSFMVGGTHSRAAQTAMAKSKKDKYSFIKQEVHCSYYSYRLIDDAPLHPEFIRSLLLLPPLHTEATKSDYARFITTFGTHFIRKVHLGGQVKSITSLRVCQASLDGYTETDVKDCLEAEASVSTGTVEGKAEAKYCKGNMKKHDTKESFHSTFKDRFTQVVGGQSDGSSDLLFSDKSAFSKWKSSLNTVPDITTYSLQPLHLLVKQKKKRSGLKKAVEDYILEHALVKRCSDQCSGGASPSAHDSCECVCQEKKQMTSRCCPEERGLAHLTVTVKSATGLWGDTFSQTDSFVKVFMGKKPMQTRVIYNNNNPHWNEPMYFGTIKLSMSSELMFEVYDEDKEWYKWWNDLLGKCSLSVKQGSHDGMCPMNHGNLFFSYKAECAPGLGGSTCGEYRPSGMPSDQEALYTSRNALNVTQDLLAHIRMGQPPRDPLAFILKQREVSSRVEAHPRLPALSEL